MRKKLAPLLALVILAFFMLITPAVSAQVDSADVTSTFAVIDDQAVDGDILIYTDQGLTRTTDPSSNHIFGVLQLNPVLVFKAVNDSNQPVARGGVSAVNITTINGDIKKGDFITTSPISGKGQKATTTGYVIGVALADFSTNGPKQNFAGKDYYSGQISVAVRPEYAEISSARSINRFLELLNAALFRSVQDPEKFIQIVRYMFAGIIIVAAFAIAFFTFSRSLIKSVEAIGRNPLAKNSIQFSLIVNSVLTIVIALIGTVAAFMLLRI